ncbi:copper chaperone PCu(A)C [Glutamicibacter sp.]|uniref:copper chaperone PCu(A)C n=1 Tax=Glutamicibacter sp. TaxID=1931995 RepID=UPI0028BE490A|nr:copper chaperone PCu(A)C [Glutamicibacter sp.]
MKSTKTTAALLGLGLLLTGCSAAQAPAAQEKNQEQNQAQALQASDTWAKAAKDGMSAGFGTLHNAGTQTIEITGVSDAAGNEIQLHETTGTGADATMKQMEGALKIEPGQDATLEPGGSHLMFMDLKQPLTTAQSTSLTFTFSDGSTADVDFEIRNFTGANENYEHGMDHSKMKHDG